VMILYNNNPIITDIFLRGQDRKILKESKDQEEKDALVRRFMTQVKQAVQDFETKYEKRIRNIKVVSDLSNIEDYLSIFRKNLVNIGFKTFDPIDGLKIPQQLEQQLNKTNRSYLSTVVGLAFRKLDVFGYYKFVTAVKNINLLPNRQGMAKQKKMKAISNFAFKGFVGGVIGIYVILFALSFWNIHSYNQKLKDFSKVKKIHTQKSKELKAQIKDIEEIVSVADRALFNITNDINTLKNQLQEQINQAVSFGCSFTAQPENREDYLAVKRYEGLDDYEGEPFSADLETVMTETGKNGIGKGYRTVYEEDSDKGGLIGTAFTLRDPGGIMTDLTTVPRFVPSTVCDDFIAGIATFQPAIDALRALINTAQIGVANQLKDKKTEAEVISWGYGNSAVEMKERIQANVDILETLNANVGLFRTS